MSGYFSGSVYYAVQGVSTFESVDEILETATEWYFLMDVPQKGLSLKAKKA